jgi:hypothetical protein
MMQYCHRLSDKERANPPPIGSIITYRYQELTDAGVPRFPTYVGIRYDAKWPPENIPTIDHEMIARNKEAMDVEKKSKKKKDEKSDEEEEDEGGSNNKHKKQKKNPPLEGAIICVVGMEEYILKQLVGIIEKHGGKYSESLSRSISIFANVVTK